MNLKNKIRRDLNWVMEHVFTCILQMVLCYSYIYDTIFISV